MWPGSRRTNNFVFDRHSKNANTSTLPEKTIGTYLHYNNWMHVTKKVTCRSAKTKAVIIEFVSAGRRSPVLPLINFEVCTDYSTPSNKWERLKMKMMFFSLGKKNIDCYSFVVCKRALNSNILIIMIFCEALCSCNAKLEWSIMIHNKSS